MKNMASENHFLLSFFASRNPKQVLFKTTPILLLYVYVLSLSSTPFYKLIISYFLGCICWSLFEYFVHRIVYHKRTKNKNLQWYLDAMHLHHHKNLKDYRVLNAGYLLIYPLTLIVLFITYIIVGKIDLVASFGLGMTLYYLFYEYVHYQIHYKVHHSGYFNFIQKYHLYHHYNNWKKNYGNTTTIWDRVFNTYDSDYRKMNLTKEQIQDLIMKS